MNQANEHTKVLITGADGMLGSNLARLLLQRGYHVSALVYPGTRSQTLDGLPITIIKENILNYSDLQTAFAGTDIVIHAAASTNVWPSRSKMVCKINVEGTSNVIEAALSQNVKRLIYIGSASSVNTTDDGKGKYRFPGAKYGLDYIDSKFEAFSKVMEAVKSRQLPALAILPTYMIGPYDSLPGSGKMILAIAQGKLKMHTDGGRNFIHVNDVAEAIANSIENGQIGKFYIAGNQNLTYREFFAMVASVCGCKAPAIRMPGFAVKTFGWLGSIYGTTFGKEPLLSYPMARISCDRQYINPEASKNELNMPKTDISVAIQDCYNWFLENNYLTK